MEYATKKHKKPLPMFFVELKPAVNNKEIYDTNSLLQCKIKFEQPHVRRELPQCSKCQRYGHTKNFCFHQARYVKCAGNYATTKCLRKTRSNDVKCVLYNGNYSANYKGCRVYKDLQRNMFPALRKKTIYIKSPISSSNMQSEINLTTQSYVQAASILL